MTSKRIVDRPTVQNAFYGAKAERARFLRDAWREASHTIRWSGLVTVLVLSVVIFFGGRYVSGAHAGKTHGVGYSITSTK